MDPQDLLKIIIFSIYKHNITHWYFRYDFVRIRWNLFISVSWSSAYFFTNYIFSEFYICNRLDDTDNETIVNFRTIDRVDVSKHTDHCKLLIRWIQITDDPARVIVTTLIHISFISFCCMLPNFVTNTQHAFCWQAK